MRVCVALLPSPEDSSIELDLSIDVRDCMGRTELTHCQNCLGTEKSSRRGEEYVDNNSLPVMGALYNENCQQ